jgi:uracil-DNA glycosylase
MDIKIEETWKNPLKDAFNSISFKELADFVRLEYVENQIFPPGREIFNAFWHCPLPKVKVVILGQDPYHGLGQAHGLSFSVRPGVPFPPSLLNIFKELKRDLGLDLPPNGDLTRWADQGVFLLNATLTVRANQAGSHQQKGWETFTDEVIKVINRERKNAVFMLWGAYAGKKAELIEPQRHLVLKAPHPSPLSAHRGFLGCSHFSKANEYLIQTHQEPIRW